MKTTLNQIEKTEKKLKRREKKKKPKMRVSGKSVFKLRGLIRERKHHSEPFALLEGKLREESHS